MLEFTEADPLPAVCQACVDAGREDCDECEHMMERWLISPEYEHWLERIAKERAIARLQRELAQSKE